MPVDIEEVEIIDHKKISTGIIGLDYQLGGAGFLRVPLSLFRDPPRFRELKKLPNSSGKQMLRGTGVMTAGI